MDIIDYVNVKKMPLHIGVDFNVGQMAAIVALYLKETLYCFHEFFGLLDTPVLIEAIKETFPECPIITYPDASCRKRGSQDAGLSDYSLLKKARFIVKARNKNPFIKDRVAAVNNAFKKKKLFLDEDRCPEMIECLEQQIYTKNGIPDKDSGLDHMNDALGYMVYYLMPLREFKPSFKGLVQ